MSPEKKRGEPQIHLKVVGSVRSSLKGQAVNHSPEWKGQASLAELVIDPSLRGILEGIEDFSHLVVLYWAHEVPSESRSITRVHPRGRKELPLVGVFATLSPARPNNICVTVVRLVGRDGNVLTVEGLDALEGSPIIDIKPYLPHLYPTEGVKVASWAQASCHKPAVDPGTYSQDDKGN